MPNLRLPAAVAAAGLFGASALSGSAPLDVILASGAAAPGTESGTVFDSFAAPAINDSGKVAFLANLTGTAGLTTAIYVGNVGNWQLAAREGQSVAGGFGPLLSLSRSAIAFNNSGQVAFTGFSGSGDGVMRVFRASPTGGVQAVASAGQQAPGLPIGVTFRDFGEPIINANGHVSFNASLQGPTINATNQGSIWLYNGIVLQPVLKGGDIPNILQPTTTVRELMLPLLNNTGKMAFGGIVQGPLVAPINESARWTATGWIPSLQIVGGTLVPLSEDGGGFTVRRILPGMHRMNTNGTIAFFADHDDPQSPTTTAHSVWLTSATGIVPIVTRTTTLESLGQTLSVAAFSSVFIDSNDGVHFKATVSGSGVTEQNDHGFFSRRANGTVYQRIRSGELAPGINSARRMIELSPYVAVGPLGQLVVNAPLTGFIPGVRYDRVVVVNQPDGSTSKLIATGDQVTVNSVSKTIDTIANYYGGNGQDGAASSINATGDMILRLRFTDGTWAIVRSRIGTACPGDLDGDGIVDDADFTSFVVFYNELAGGGGDMNHDGATDDSDFVAFAVAYDRLLCP